MVLRSIVLVLIVQVLLPFACADATTMSKSAVAAGGISRIESSQYSASCTVGLPIVGLSEGSQSRLNGGFWSRQDNVTDTEVRGQVPQHTRLLQNYPNPFNPSTTLEFDLSGADGQSLHTALRIISIDGREIQTLVHDSLLPGVYRVQWDGRDRRGDRVSSGLYIAELRAGNTRHNIRMVILK